MKRPTSITVLSIYLVAKALAFGVLSFRVVGNPAVEEALTKSSVPLIVQYGFLFIGLAVILVSGIGMLNGINWCRWLYAVGAPMGIVFNMATSPRGAMAFLTPLLLYGVILYFLFRPKANQYFASGSSS